MDEEVTVFKLERRASRAAVAAVLRTLADGIERGHVDLGEGAERIALEPPDELELEVEVELEEEGDEGLESSIEVEISWVDRDARGRGAGEQDDEDDEDDEDDDEDDEDDEEDDEDGEGEEDDEDDEDEEDEEGAEVDGEEAGREDAANR